jgi:hypothetical protein
MGYWLFLGLSLAGCGVGALLTAVVYLTQLNKVKTDLQEASGSLQEESQVAADPKDGKPQWRVA